MSDINETLLTYYHEALDMGMTEDDAKVWAWDKLYGWREQMSKKNKATMELDIVMLKRNVADLQQQLGNANKRIVELTAELSRKQEALLDIAKIFSKTTQRDILLERK